MMALNPETLKLFRHLTSEVVATLIIEDKNGARNPMVLLRNDVGVYGTLTPKGHHVLWGHPGNPEQAIRRLTVSLPNIGFKVWNDDGHVLRPFNFEEVKNS